MKSQSRYHSLTPGLISKLTRIVGPKNILIGEGRENYARDESTPVIYRLPDVVVKPENAEAVSGVLKLAHRNYIPVTPRGAGTGLTAGSVPIFGGISLSLENLNKIIEIDTANFCATAEAGVRLEELCTAVEAQGLYFPLYPGEKSAFIGGNAATNAGGMRAVRYGVTRNFVLGLEAVLPTGEIIQTGGKYIKCATGYDLTQLLVGSEGTLAVITQVTVKLMTPPGNRELLFIPFNSLDAAIKCVPAILKEKILPVGIEFMEHDILEMVKEYTGKEIPLGGYPAYLMLIVESGSYDEFCKTAERISEVCLKMGAADVFVPGSESAKRNLLEIREKFHPALKRQSMLDIADVVVPRSEIAVFVGKVKGIGRKYNIKIIASGHAGDGNVHLHPMGMEEDPLKIKSLMAEIYQVGVALGGTISGEHGLGYGKKNYLPLAVSGEKLALMQRLKKAFDPHHFLNPGKVLD